MSTSDALPAPRPPLVDASFARALVLLNGAIPLAILAWDAAHDQLGANGVNHVIRTTGLLALLFLLLSLAVTPLRRLTGAATLLAVRRTLGLYAFGYLVVHFVVFFAFDRAASLRSTLHEILTRQYLQVGTLGLVLMIPLAITSNDAIMLRLGARRWKALHRTAYLAAALGALHYYMLVKADVRQPLAFAAVLAVLLLARLVPERRRPTAVTPTAAAPLARPRPRFWTGELRVARVFDETPEVRTFRLVADGNLPFDHRPGQYLTLTLTVAGRRVNRSYTIASPPTRSGYCELTVKREPSGVASAHLHETLREGSVLRVSAPAGRFVFDGTGADGVTLLAGGVGITPLMSMIRHLTDRGWSGQIRLVFSVRTARDVIFADELAYLERRFPTLRVLLVVTRDAPADFPCLRGRLTADALTRFVPELTRWPVYLCGPDPMMDASRALLRDLGVPDDLVHTEAFVSPAAPSDADAGPVAVAATESALARAVDPPSPDLDLDTVVRFARTGKDVPLRPDQTLLEAAEEVGIDLPYECRSGICGQCKVRKLAGEVTMDSEDALGPREKASGVILACQARGHRGLVVLDA